MKMQHLVLLIIVSQLILDINAYSSQIQFNSNTIAQSITNFNTDLGSCSCNTSGACDVFCCCDTQCTADKITAWTTSGWCSNNVAQIEKLCQKIGTVGFSSFEDLGCIVFSNRGSIGSYYDLPDVNNRVSPNVQKFSTLVPNAPQFKIPPQQNYQQNSPIRIKRTSPTNTIENSPLFTWVPSLGQSCRRSYMTLTQGTYNSECIYLINNQKSCQDINSLILGSNFQYCQFGNCTSFITPNITVATVNTPTYTAGSPGSCSNIVTKIEAQIFIQYTNSQYKISRGTLRFTTSNVNGQKVTLYTSISIKKVRASSSGNPGYLFGKPLQYVSGGIYSITDANQNCVTNSSVNPSSSLNIKFGINETFTCFTSTPCSSTLYIDQIPLASSFKPSKYAQPTTEPANIAAISSNCNIESYTFHILYSYSGWVMDPQYYIIGSTFTATQSVNPIRMKQLNVKWIKVEPSQVYTPPTNYFYTYFQKLWLPLKSSIYRVSSNSNLLLYTSCLLGFIGILIFL